MTAIVLLGPPGAGKGTVAEALVEKGYTHISTGDLLRQQIRLETPLGLDAKKLMDQGQFVSDDTVVGIIRDLLQNSDKDTRFLFDGFPRTIAQAEKFDKLLHSMEERLDRVIVLECPDQTIIDRLSGRRTCKTCGAVYHIDYNPSSKGSRCAADGGELVQRPDDQAETIMKRLKIYTDRTAPLIEYYNAKNLIQLVDAAQCIEEVRSAVLERLG